jgi:hypothetical protein
MDIKNSLIGSVVALAEVAGARSADAIVSAEHKPVRCICDVGGTETQLSISASY